MKYKDPITGEFKNIPLKASDTLPVGSIVDYDGDTVPDGWEEVSNENNEVLTKIYPVGSIYMSVNNTDPSTLFGGTWEQLKDRFLLGAGSTYSNGATGGSATHKLTVNEMPSHKHTGIEYDNGNSVSLSESGNTGYNISWSKTGNSTRSDLQTNSTGGSKAHNNMPPYLVVYMWKRTA